MDKKIKIFLGIGIPLVVIGIILILWAAGMFASLQRPPGKPPTGKKIFNTYILSPNDMHVLGHGGL